MIPCPPTKVRKIIATRTQAELAAEIREHVANAWRKAGPELYLSDEAKGTNHYWQMMEKEVPDYSSPHLLPNGAMREED
jgi:sugar lactone lactonase YvrE